MTPPGVGAIIALDFASAIDDPSRFKSSQRVGCYFGLTPRKYQSGQTDITGHISKIGDKQVRCSLYEAAHVILTRSAKPSGLKRWAQGVVKVAGVRKGKVALARRLAVMRDSSIGVFGALALIGWALLLVAVLDRLGAARAVEALVAAGALGRWAALLHAVGSPPARAEGLGASFGVGRVALALASVVAVAGTIALCGVVAGLAAIAAGVVVAALSVLHVRATLGGRTGDTLGATVALAEVIVCVALLAVWGG